MQENSRRKHRSPLSSEELFYIKKIKQLKESKKIEDFKSSLVFKTINSINIALAAFLSYGLLSITICCYWQTDKILTTHASFSEYNREIKKVGVSDVDMTTVSGHSIKIKTNQLYQEPQSNETVYLGKDFMFNKIVKIKFGYDSRCFWPVNSYAALTVILFALILGFFIYQVNKHLYINGLITVLGLFTLASLYFIMI